MMSFTVSAMIQRYHVYKKVWNAEVDEELQCEREHTVAIRLLLK